MLIKLLKYDLKSMIKTILPLWIAAIAISVFYGFFNIINKMANIGHVILITTLFAIFIAIIVINVMLVIQRFWNGLLKDEGYLMFTIPTSPRMLIISKAISATIISTITAIVAIISVFLIMSIYMLPSNQNIFMDILENISKIKGMEYLSILIFIIAALVGAIQKIYVFYAAMAWGHLSNRNRFLSSVGAFLVINVLLGSLTSLLASMSDGIFSTLIGFNVESSIDISSSMILGREFNAVMLVSIGVSIVLTILLHMMTEWILTHRLNLE